MESFLHLFSASVISFIRILSFPYTDFVHIVSHLHLSISFWVILMLMLLFLTSYSTCSLLVYMKAMDFRIFSLCLLSLYLPSYNHLVLGVCQFFKIFYIGDQVICRQRQLYVFLPNLYILHFLFFCYCISKELQYDAEHQRSEGKPLPCF